MLIELRVNFGERFITTHILIDNEKKSSNKYYDEIDYYLHDFFLFEKVIQDLRLVCKDIGRDDLVKLLKFKVKETSEYHEDDWDSYYEELMEFIFDGKIFRVSSWDDVACENTEFSDLIWFLNTKILNNTDTEILLTTTVLGDDEDVEIGK